MPIVLVGFFTIARHSDRLAAGWLTLASLLFYGWWDPRYVVLLLVSIVVNFQFGKHLALLRASNRRMSRSTKFGCSNSFVS